jgi:hypothetical protein
MSRFLAAKSWVSVVKLAVGGGSWLVSLEMDTVPSRRPRGTAQKGPLLCMQCGKGKLAVDGFVEFSFYSARTVRSRTTDGVLTSHTASLAMSARMSAQETVSGHAASTAALTLSMKSKPRSVWFGCASFSAVLLPVVFRRTEPSHPCTTIHARRATG